VFTRLCRVAVEIGAVADLAEFDKISIVKWDTVFRLAFDYLTSLIEIKLEKPLRKPGELKVNTFYNYLKELM
jgi:hypothetical protein